MTDIEEALATFDAGWRVMPLPLGTKGPPPEGLTGVAGRDLSRDEVVAIDWSGRNIAVRAGDDQLGIDVDAYAGGLETMRALVAELGPLPRTYASHSGRDDGSGIYWYRVPPGIKWIAGLPGVEVIQRTHRYAVVAPSVHPDGRTYGWWDGLEQAPLEGVPLVEDTPELPWPWVARLTRGTLVDGTGSAGVGTPEEVARFVAEHVAARATRYLPMVVEHFARQVTLGMSRHDTMTHCLAWAMGEARAGDYSAAVALEQLGAAWRVVMDVPRRAALDVPGRATEWQAMVGWAVRRAEQLEQHELDAIADEHQGPQLEADEEPPEPDDEPPPAAEAAAEGEQPDDPDLAGAVIDTDPADFFTRNGLKALTLAHALLDIGPLAMGDDGLLYRHRLGVWLPDGARIVDARCVHLLRNRVRSSHVSAARLVLASRPAAIHAEQPERHINVRNGLLDWRTGELGPHQPALGSTYQLSVPWQPDATCPTVDRWMAEVVEADVVPLLWEVLGVAVYGRLPFHRAVMLTGPGRNGKGTLLRLVQALVGARHCSSVTLQQLAEDRFAAAQLFGKVVNLAGDLDARAIAATGLFKMATGGDLVMAQRKYGQPFEFTNQALMLFSANELPTARDHTLGYESRWIVVPFTRVTLKPDEEDKSLEPRMHLELEGVLVRAVAGLRRAIARDGFDRPPSVIAATEEFHRASNPLHAFVDECLEVTGMPHHHVARASVLDAYLAWCRRNGHGAMSARRFWPQLMATDERIDTGVTVDSPNGHRHGQVRIVQGIEVIHHPGSAL